MGSLGLGGDFSTAIHSRSRSVVDTDEESSMDFTRRVRSSTCWVSFAIWESAFSSCFSSFSDDDDNKEEEEEAVLFDGIGVGVG